MDKRSLDLLEKVFAAEIDGAAGGIGVFQTKSKLAQKLEADGYLVKEQRVIPGRFAVRVEGYRLTILGNMTYCMSGHCIEDVTPNAKVTGSPALSASPCGLPGYASGGNGEQK